MRLLSCVTPFGVLKWAREYGFRAPQGRHTA